MQPISVSTLLGLGTVLFNTLTAMAQPGDTAQTEVAPPVVSQKTRFRFAQTHVGFDFQYVPPVESAYPANNGTIQPVTVPGTYHPRFNIGATHFWGLLDFYVSFPLAMLKPKAEYLANYGISTGITTGARVHPLQLRYHRMNPYLGVTWSTLAYLQQPTERLSGSTITRHIATLEGGLNWVAGSHMVEVGFHYLPVHQLTYPTSRQTDAAVRFNPVTFQVAYKFMIDATRPLEKDSKADFGHYLGQRHQLSGWHIDIGPSAAFTLVRSDYNATLRPYINNPAGNDVFWDLSTGYYFFKPDFDVRLAYRNIRASQNAYDLTQNLGRRSISLEAYKYLLDYQGFVPFLGLSLSQEQLTVQELDAGKLITDQTHTLYSPGIIFGWDIRPVRFESIVLRTNLRYSPFLKTSVDGRAISFQQLEFNFIQAVIYPNRLLARRRFDKADR